MSTAKRSVSHHWQALATVSSKQCVAENIGLDRAHLRTLSAAERMAMVVGALEKNGKTAAKEVSPAMKTQSVVSGGPVDPATGRPVMLELAIPDDPSHPLQRSISLHEKIKESHGMRHQHVVETQCCHHTSVPYDCHRPNVPPPD